MANEPQSPISDLAARLAQQPALKSRGIPVFPWRKAQAKNTAARRIVIYPTRMGLPTAASKPDSLCDAEPTMAAEIWGANGEMVWAMMTWLIQALESQGVGDDTAGPGYWFDLLGADWETAADTSAEGEVVTVLFSFRCTVAALAYDVGHMGVWPTGRIDSVTETVTEEA